jgi:DNA-binding protein YbaB
MSTEQIRALLRIKSVIDQLRAIDQDTLTPTEREALQDMLAQAYDRAAYLLRKP